jgi:hypothetical protein
VEFGCVVYGNKKYGDMGGKELKKTCGWVGGINQVDESWLHSQYVIHCSPYNICHLHQP